MPSLKKPAGAPLGFDPEMPSSGPVDGAVGDAASPVSPTPPPDLAAGADSAAIAADVDLAARCVAGEVAAWEAFYAQCHEPLLVAIRLMLPASHRDPHQVEEVASAVWYELVKDDGEVLRKYTPRYGARLGTFLRSIARDLVARHVRSEQRRRDREAASAAEKPAFHSPDASPEFNEFFASLTPQEREFLGEFLSAEDRDLLGSYCGPSSRSGIWRVTQEIKRKLFGYFGGK